MSECFYSSSIMVSDWNKTINVLGKAILFPSTQIIIAKGHPVINMMYDTINKSDLLQNEIEKITDEEVLFKNGSRICICELKEDNHIIGNMTNIIYFDDVIKQFVNENIK